MSDTEFRRIAMLVKAAARKRLLFLPHVPGVTEWDSEFRKRRPS